MSSQGAAVSVNGGKVRWRHKLPRWHESARAIAAMVLLDQALTLTSIPSSEGIVVACIAALFAPIPVERRKE